MSTGHGCQREAEEPSGTVSSKKARTLGHKVEDTAMLEIGDKCQNDDETASESFECDRKKGQ